MSGVKYLGYVLAGIGALGVILSTGNIKDKIPQLATFSSKIILLIAIGILAVGVVLMVVFDKSGSARQKQKEVPIYKGNEIIGYRQATR